MLVEGDMLSEVFVPMLADFGAGSDPLERYLVWLRVLQSAAERVDVVVSGHGSIDRAHAVHARIELNRA